MPNVWEDNALYTHYKVSTVSGHPLSVVAGLEIPDHDYISLSYVSGTTTLTGVVYKTGGSGGTTVATLTLAYDNDDNLASVTKS
jgi:hypothetical protein